MTSIQVHRLAMGVCLLTFLLLGVGSLVTSTGSGLAVPDWPLSYGHLVPPLHKGVLFEYGHRVVAAGVGLLTLGLVILLWLYEERRWVKGLGTGIFLAILAQAVLGGVTVLYHLPTVISVAHAGLSMLIFSASACLAYVTSPTWNQSWPVLRDRPQGVSIRALCLLTGGGIYLQILLGAWMRHTPGASIAIPTFPLAYGYWIPPLSAHNIQIHFSHRVGALIVLLVSLWMAVAIIRYRRQESQREKERAEWISKKLGWWAGLLGKLLVVQILLGGTVIWTWKGSRPMIPATAHVLVGALLLAISGMLTLNAFRLLSAPVSVGASPLASGS